jgi:hypothetical protein
MPIVQESDGVYFQNLKVYVGVDVCGNKLVLISPFLTPEYRSSNVMSHDEKYGGIKLLNAEAKASENVYTIF